ncbi:hypothetical protein D3C72_1322600 [compost metagenome]
MAWLASRVTPTSSIAMSIWSPCPVTSRRASAARMALLAYSPVIRSTMGTPIFIGPPPGRSSDSPVMLISPLMAWIMKS